MAEWQVAEWQVTIVVHTPVPFVAKYAQVNPSGSCTVPHTHLHQLHGFAVPSVAMEQMTAATSAGM